MNALDYILKDVNANIAYDEAGSLYLDFGFIFPGGTIAKFLDKFAQDMWQGMYLVMRETCEFFRQYEVTGEDVEFSADAKRAYYRLRGKSVSRENAFEIIRRTDYFLNNIDEIAEQDEFIGYWNFGDWVSVDGNIGCNANLQWRVTKEEIVFEWLRKLMKFPYLDLIICISRWNESSPATDKYEWDSSFCRNCEWECPEYDDEFYDAVEIGIHVHDKKIELLSPKDAVKVYKKYDDLYGKDWARYTFYLYDKDNIERVDEAYIRRCITAYGFDADEILRKRKWREG